MAVTKKAGLRHLCSSFASLVLRVLCLLHIFFLLYPREHTANGCITHVPAHSLGRKNKQKNFNLIFNKILCTERFKKIYADS